MPLEGEGTASSTASGVTGAGSDAGVAAAPDLLSARLRSGIQRIAPPHVWL